MRLVSISGPPSAGKTTLLKALVDDFGDRIEVVPDLPRHALHWLGATLPEADRESFQHFVGYSALLAEATPPAAAGSVRVLDKSLIDAVAYWDVLIGKSHPAWAQQLQPRRYSLVVVCDHSGIPPSDSLSHLHADHRDRIYEAVRELASRATERLLLVSGSPEERRAKVARALRDLL